MMIQSMWTNLKGAEPSVIHLDNLDSIGLSTLYTNCCRMGNIDNINVSLATVNPDIYIGELVDVILENVSYISKFPSFQLTSYINGEFVSCTYTCETLEFENIDDIKKTISEMGKFSILVLYSIVKLVNLETMKSSFTIKIAEIKDIKQIRNKKIDYLTKK